MLARECVPLCEGECSKRVCVAMHRSYIRVLHDRPIAANSVTGGTLGAVGDLSLIHISEPTRPY